MTHHIGIDPGATSGGLTLLSPSGQLVDKTKMPDTDRDLLDLLLEWERSFPGVRATMEHVHCNGKNGCKANWSLGGSYRAIKMALTAAGIPYEEVSAVKWQRPFRLPTHKQAGSPTKKKNAHKARAQELFPGEKFTHATGDSTLIAEWGRRNAK